MYKPLPIPAVTLLITAAACSKDHEPTTTTTGVEASIPSTDGTSPTFASTVDDTVAPGSDESYDYPDPSPACGDVVCGPDEICVSPLEQCQSGQEQGCPGDSTTAATESPSGEPCWDLVQPPSSCVSTQGCNRGSPDFESCLVSAGICDCDSPHVFQCGLNDIWHISCGFYYCYPYYGYCDDECF